MSQPRCSKGASPRWKSCLAYIGAARWPHASGEAGNILRFYAGASGFLALYHISVGAGKGSAMAQENKVMQSFEEPGGLRCADIFRRPDGTFGYQLCRRDPEDGRGWAVYGGDPAAVFATMRDAGRAARAHAPWIGA